MAALTAVETGFHLAGEFDDAISERKKGVVLADTDILADDYAGAALADDDHARLGFLAVSNLNAQKLRIGVREVLGCSSPFFCCHIFVYCAK